MNENNYMPELIHISYDGNDKPTVSGRELHQALEVQTQYSIWFKRMCEYGFSENVDFTLVIQKRLTNNPKNPYTEITDHQLTIGMAKELCMIQRSEIGKKCRQYFLEIERQWNSPEAVMARALKVADVKLLEARQHIQALETRVEEMRPKEIFADAVANSDDCILIGDLAKLLKQNGIDIGQNRLFEWMRSNGYLMKKKSSKAQNKPTQMAMDMGLFKVIETSITLPKGSKTSLTVKVTGKGQQYFINKFLAVTEVQGVLEYVE